jgi:hypothetical protein
MATKYGLPTFPIADGMVLGTRSRDEYLWLLDRGWLQYKWADHVIRYRKDGMFCKKSSLTIDEEKRNRHAPEEVFEIVPIDNALRDLEMLQECQLEMWGWYSLDT